MAEVNDEAWVDLKKIKEIFFGTAILLLIILPIYWFFGVIDKPKYVGVVQGNVTGCTQALSKHGSHGAIFCGANLANGDSATFQSGSYLSANQRVQFKLFKGAITGRNSYVL